MPKTVKEKGKCVLNEKLRVKYPFLEPGKSENEVFCRKCRSTFLIASGGNADILRHLKAVKHLAALSAASTSQTLTSFFSSTFDAQTAALEGVWAFHVIKSNHSFKSSDCATKILKTCFKMKQFSCSQTKCQAILVNVFAPQVQKMLQDDLNKCRYVSVYTDASNHGNIKLFPVLVR